MPMRTMRWQAVRRRRKRLIWLIILVVLVAWWLWPNQEAKKEAEVESAAVLGEDAFTVFIHPGNGGTEDGPIYPNESDTPEFVAKNINLAVAQAASRALAKEGIKTVLSRETDTFVDAIDRKERAENEGASLSLAIYVNSNYNDLAIAGFQIVDYKKVDWPEHYKQRAAWSRNLEKALLDRLASYGAPSLGVFARNSAFVPDMPTVVLMIGFLSNDIERERITNEDYQWEIANGITDAVVFYRDNLASKTDYPTDVPPEDNISDIRVPF